jgi:hypothetical protein
VVWEYNLWGAAVAAAGLWWGDPMLGEHLEDQDLNGKKILKRIFKN